MCIVFVDFEPALAQHALAACLRVQNIIRTVAKQMPKAFAIRTADFVFLLA
jgi:hypothetical protein